MDNNILNVQFVGSFSENKLSETNLILCLSLNHSLWRIKTIQITVPKGAYQYAKSEVIFNKN